MNVDNTVLPEIREGWDSFVNRAEADRRRWQMQGGDFPVAHGRRFNGYLATLLTGAAVGWGFGLLCGLGVRG
jgi:hypothetical protein